MTRIAVVGLGGMGSRIAGRLLGAGHQLVVWNRSPERAEPLLALGARRAASPAAAATAAEVLITMVTGPTALREVSEGPEEIAATARAPLIVLEMSTVGPDAVLRLRRSLADGVRLLDAPVLGSHAEAERGSLSIFVGGPAELYLEVKALLAPLGTTVRVGELGQGAAAKLVANSTLFASLLALGEALALSQALGLSSPAAFEVLSRSPLASQAERRREAVERGDYPLHFPLRLAGKDLRLIAESAAAHDLALPLAAAARAEYKDAERTGWGERDYSAILEYVLGRVGSVTDRPSGPAPKPA
ncbi:MAG: NAD(P)-dependent oxidoreductase [Candidatus Dormibacteria bacterium]